MIWKWKIICRDLKTKNYLVWELSSKNRFQFPHNFFPKIHPPENIWYVVYLSDQCSGRLWSVCPEFNARTDVRTLSQWSVNATDNTFFPTKRVLNCLTTWSIVQLLKSFILGVDKSTYKAYNSIRRWEVKKSTPTTSSRCQSVSKSLAGIKSFRWKAKAFHQTSKKNKKSTWQTNK